MQYNEIAYAEKMIKEGFIGKSYTTDLFILSKYLRHVKEMKKQDHVDYIKDFCSKYLIDYNEVLMGNKIDRAIENGRKLKNKPLVIESIPLYKEELECINRLEISEDYKKILLSMLFSKKLSHEKARQLHSSTNESWYLGGNKKKYSEILKASKTKDRYNIHLVISELIKLGILTSTYNSDIVLSFMDEVECGEVLYNVKPTDFWCIGLYMDLYLDNKNVKLCDECNRIIKLPTKNSNMKYCKDCAKVINIEKTKKNRVKN